MASLKRKREETQSIEPESIVISNKYDLSISKNKLEEVLKEFTIFKNSEKGKILIIQGPHGSGKTITIKLVAKYLELPLQVWSAKDISNEETPLSNYDQLCRDLKNLCSVKFRIKLPNISRIQDPTKIILIDSFPQLNDTQKKIWVKLINDISKYSNKILCFIASDISNKTISQLFQSEACKVIQ